MHGINLYDSRNPKTISYLNCFAQASSVFISSVSLLLKFFKKMFVKTVASFCLTVTCFFNFLFVSIFGLRFSIWQRHRSTKYTRSAKCTWSKFFKSKIQNFFVISEKYSKAKQNYIWTKFCIVYSL